MKMAKGKKININLYMGIFLIIVGLLPFLGVSTGVLAKFINALVIVSGIIIVVGTR